MKIAIIGTGISGLSVAQMLKDKHQIILFEKENRSGGMIKCDRINSILFHKIGGHVFNSKNQAVLDWFWKHFDKEHEFLLARRNAKVYFNKQIIGYPIENYIYNFEEEIVKKIFLEIFDLQKQAFRDPFSYPNFESFLQNSFGQTLYNLYFKPYNEKIWNTDLSKVSMPWLEGKLPMPNYQEIILANILRVEETNMVHSQFYYPKNNGSQFIVDRLSEGLDIRISHEVLGWKTEGGKYTIEGVKGFDKIIYTGDIRKLPTAVMKSLELETTVDLNYIRHLPTNGTSNLLCEVDENTTSWLYIPQHFTKAHRIIYTGNFSPSNNGGNKRKTCVVEFSGKVDYETMLNEISKLPGNLKALASNYEPNSYVIQDSQTRLHVDALKQALSKENVYLLGRFAEWEYYNMDKCIEAAFRLCDVINA